MLIGAKAFPSASVNDLRKAKQFYGETLGLKVSERSEGLDVRAADGTGIFIYPKSNHSPATFTILNFPVDNIKKAAEELVKRGVRFEQYEGDLKTDEKGIF